MSIESIHPAILDAANDLQKTKVSPNSLNRREFLRAATLLGTSLSSAYALSGCSRLNPFRRTAETGANSPIKRGGTLTIAMPVPFIGHPATVSDITGANIIRQVGEYLTEIGPDNLVYPYLLERWESNQDATEWTLYLRQGVKFSDESELTADDVLFTFEEWLDPNLGSSMRGLLSYLPNSDSVEKVDDYTIKLHLSTSNIYVPEHLAHYPAIILPKTFEGGFISDPVGTGAFTIESYESGERAVLTARPDYWRLGADGAPLPYLDRVVYMQADEESAFASLLQDEVDAIHQPRLNDWYALSEHPSFTVRSVNTSRCFLLRMRTDKEPWSDVRVRNALKLCQNREEILSRAYRGQGVPAMDAHVAPIHPTYCALERPTYAPEQARSLLAAAGYGGGLPVLLTVKNEAVDSQIALALKEMAAPAGFEIELDFVSPSSYWEQWTEVDLGITPWSHYPLSTMPLSLAYTADADGNPSPWNETRWVDTEFTAKVREVERTVDMGKRRSLMCDIQTIMQERSGIGNSFWLNTWNITRSVFQNVKAHPAGYDLLYDVWRDDL